MLREKLPRGRLPAMFFIIIAFGTAKLLSQVFSTVLRVWTLVGHFLLAVTDFEGTYCTALFASRSEE